MPADARPQVVIAAGRDRPPVGVPQQLPVRRGVPVLAVLRQAAHQGGGDRLPADRLALLPQQHQALVRVQIGRPQGQGPAAAAGCLGMQPQQQRVQLWIITRGRGDLVDLGQPGLGHGAAGGRQPPRLGHLAGRIAGLADQAVLDRPLVQAAQRGH